MSDGVRFLAKLSPHPSWEVSFPRHMSPERTDSDLIPPPAGGGTLRGFLVGKLSSNPMRRLRAAHFFMLRQTPLLSNCLVDTFVSNKYAKYWISLKVFHKNLLSIWRKLNGYSLAHWQKPGFAYKILDLLTKVTYGLRNHILSPYFIHKYRRKDGFNHPFYV